MVSGHNDMEINLELIKIGGYVQMHLSRLLWGSDEHIVMRTTNAVYGNIM